MGGSSGGGGRVPVEGKNTAKSGQRYTSIHAIGEGVLAGFGNGDDAPLKSVYLNDTPIQNADGSFNFKGVEIFAMPGTLDQSNVPGFDVTERAVGVSAEVKNGAPVIRTVVDSAVDTLRVTVGINMNTQTQDNGDTVAASTSVLIELLNKDGVKTARSVVFAEKSGGMYQQDVVFDELPPVPFSVRVSRVSANSDSSRLVNNTYFSSYVEIVTAKLSYPHTALLCLKADSEQFGGQVPRVNVFYKAKLLKVPSNYNPETRTYSSPIWDGSFKEAWTNNPAWWIYDFLTQPRYSGLAKRLNAGDVDKWAFYEIAKYCDEPVDDGYGGKEPRFAFNAYLTEERPAADVLNDLASCFRGMAYWNGQQHTATLDRNSDPVALYNNSNVVDGLFTYSGAGRKSIHTAVLVQYVDKTNGHRTATEYVSDDAAVRRYGLNVKTMTAFGCNSRGQAYRIGKWLLHTELNQQETISFTVGRAGLRHLPNDIVQVLDNDRAGAMVGGRVLAVNGTVVTLDRAIDTAAGDVVGGKLLYTNDAGAGVEAVIIAQPSSTSVRLQAAPAGMAEMTEWAFVGKVKPVLYRCVAITENTEEGTYTVNAMLHDPNKEDAVDNGTVFDKEIKTLHTIEPQLIDGNLTVADGGIDFSWDTKTTAGAVVAYNVEVRRNGTLYREFFGLNDPNVRLDNLPNGNYEIRVYAINSRGQKSEPLVQAFVLDYTLKNLRTMPKLFAIDLSWSVPDKVLRRASTEIWYAESTNLAAAQKLAALPYPQTGYTLSGVSVTDRYYFWVRLVDSDGLAGEFAGPIEGKADSNPAPIVAQVQDAIFNTDLAREQIAAIVADSVVTVEIEAEALNAAEKRLREAIAETEQSARKLVAAAEAELAAGVENMQAAIAGMDTALKNYADTAVAAVAAQAQEQGGKIAALESSSADAARKISSVTVNANKALTGLAEETAARIAADKAETESRRQQVAVLDGRVSAVDEKTTALATQQKTEAAKTTALQSRMGSAESGIAATDKTVAALDKSMAERFAGVAAQYAPKTDIAAVRGEIKTAEAALAEADKAMARRIGTVETTTAGNAGKISKLEQTQATDKAATATEIQKLSASVDNIAVGGRNYFLNSEVTRTTNGRTGLEVSDAFVAAVNESREFMLSVDIAVVGGTPVASGTTRIGGEIRLHFSDGSQLYKGTWLTSANAYNYTGRLKVKHTVPADKTVVRVEAGMIQANYGSVESVSLGLPKLEIGNVATDWTPAPEDSGDAIDKVSADITSYQQAQATKEAATATRFQQAESKIAGNVSKISNLEKTSVTKDEVVTLARNGLKSEWQGYTNDVQIGGANVLNGSDFKGAANWSKVTTNAQSKFRGQTLTRVDVKTAASNLQTGVQIAADNRTSVFEQGKEYTLSFYAQGTADFIATGLNYIWLMREDGGNYKLGNVAISGSLTDKRYELTFTAPWTTEKGSLLIAATGTFAVGQWFAFHSVKIEEGNKATGWVPSNGDTRGMIETLETTQANAEKASAERFSKVEAGLGVGGNMLQNSEFLYPGNRNLPEGYTLTSHSQIFGYHNLTNSSWTYALKDEAVFGVRDMRTSTETPTAGTNSYINSVAKFPVRPGQILQFSCYVAGWGFRPNSGDLLYLDFRGSNGSTAIQKTRVKKGNYRYPNAANIAGGRLGRKAVADVYTSKAQFDRFYFNEVIPEGVDFVNIGIAIRSNFGTDCYMFCCLPQLCEVSSLNAPVMPYAPGSSAAKVKAADARITATEAAIATEKAAQATKNSSIEARIGANTAKVDQQAKSFADLNGKISATYMLRVSGSIGGQPVVAGMSLGTNGKMTNAIFAVQNFMVGDVQSGKMIKPLIVKNGNLYLAGDLFADGTILGKHIAANQTINAPKIVGGSAEFGGGLFTINTAGQVTMRADKTREVGMVITNERIEVYDEQGRLRVRLGRLS